MASTQIESSELQSGYGMSEGKLARKIEAQTAKIPSDVFLWGAVGAVGISLVSRALEMRGSRFRLMRPKASMSTFIGLWAPTLLLLGIYNKLVKVAGHDRMDRGESDEEDIEIPH